MQQHVYEFRTQLADRAERAVEDFFASEAEFFASAKDRAGYVRWAVPEDKVTFDQHGRAVITPPKFFPFMWEDSEDENKPEV
jgi:hypothetical protein